MCLIYTDQVNVVLTVTGYFREGDYAICAPVVLLQAIESKMKCRWRQFTSRFNIYFLNPLIKVKDHNNVSENIGETF